MRADVTAHNAKLRHPHEVDQIMMELKAANPEDIAWEYDVGVRMTPGFDLSNVVKGPLRFVLGAERHLLNLAGARRDNPRKKAHASLDSLALAQDPSKWPLELYGWAERPALPTTRSLWVWRPKEVAAPGWNEAVLVGGVTDGTTTVLRLAMDADWPQRAHLIKTEPGKGWSGTHTDASGRLHGFGSALLATMGQWARTGELKGVTAAAGKALAKSTVRALSETELDQVAASFPGGFVAGSDGLHAMLGQLLGGQGLILPTAGDESTASPVWGPRKNSGRRWAWGQTLGAHDLAGYAELMGSDRPASFSAQDVFGSLFNPQTQQAQKQGHELIELVARGATPDDAFEQVTGTRRTPTPTKPKIP